MDTNINSSKANTYPIKRIALAVSLVTSSLLPSYSFAQATAIQDTDPQASLEAPQTVNSVALTPAITVDNLDDIYREMATNSRFENLTPAEDFFQSPYQVSSFFQIQTVRIVTDFGLKRTRFLPTVLVLLD